MAPCSSCQRHLRVSEAECPFCGAALESVGSALPPSHGGATSRGGLALAAAITVLGSSACTSRPGAGGEDGMTTTSQGSSATDSSSESDADADTIVDTETTTMSTFTDDDDSADDNDDGPISFYACSDPYDWSLSECDPFFQDCPEGEKCVPYSSVGGTVPDANKCVAITGDGATGEPCMWGGLVESTDDCDKDNYCWYVQEVEGMLVGTCTAFCTGTADDPICAPGTSCLINWDGSTSLCLSACDPLIQDCPAGQVCGWSNQDFVCLSPLGEPPPPPLGLNEPCSTIGVCAPGLECLNGEVLPSCDAAACCGEYCDLANPDFVCADPDTSCVAFFAEGEELPGHENVGVCVTLP